MAQKEVKRGGTPSDYALQQYPFIGWYPPLSPSAKATQEKNDQGNRKDQPKCAAAKDGATKIEAPAAEQKQEHN